MVIEAPDQVLTFSRTVKAPASFAYRAFTERDWITYWFCDDASIRSEVGGHMLLTWNTGYHVMGAFTQLEKDRRAALMWRGAGETADSRVEVDIVAEGDAVNITLQHHISEEGGADANAVEREWDTRLDNLVSFLETGADLRLTNRIILGIYPDSFDEEIARRLGVPVTEGARVGNVIPDLGAAKAGLQSDDVIVALNAKPVDNQTPLNVLVQGKKPGDVVDVVFYRGAEKHTVTLNLSGYPLPDFAPDFATLAHRTKQLYAELDKDLSALFDGVSEAEASKKPAEGEWSAKDVVAHLILTERWIQHWIGGLMQGPEIAGYTANAPARIAGVINTYGTLENILAEMRRSWSETVAILRAVPQETHERKANVWWTTFELHSFSIHTRQHFRQIQGAIAAARQ